MDTYAVIMAGGTGSRLWPLSTKKKPKQTLKLLGDYSLFQEAVKRVEPLFGLDHVMVVAGRQHVPELKLHAPGIPEGNFIVEPSGMGTAPCIGLAAVHISSHNPDSVMVVLTADHHIGDVQGFRNALTAAVRVADRGHLVTLGVKPTEASTGYGYIEHGETLYTVQGFNAVKVRRFTEKPDRETAAGMVESGNYSWNSGMFIWKVYRIMEEFKTQMHDLYSHLAIIKNSLDSPSYTEVLEESWRHVPRGTIDYGVMENAEDVVVIPVDIGWSDLGSWSSLMGLLPPDRDGNVVKGRHVGIDTGGSVIIGGDRLIATIGVKGLIIVDAGDALLVCKMDMDQRVKDLVNKLKEEGDY